MGQRLTRDIGIWCRLSRLLPRHHNRRASRPCNWKPIYPMWSHHQVYLYSLVIVIRVVEQSHCDSQSTPVGFHPCNWRLSGRLSSIGTSTNLSPNVTKLSKYGTNAVPTETTALAARMVRTWNCILNVSEAQLGDKNNLEKKTLKSTEIREKHLVYIRVRDPSGPS